MRRDRAESFDDPRRTGWSEQLNRLTSIRIRQAMEEARQPGDVVRMGVGKADRAEPAKTPAESLPGNLSALAAVKERQLSLATDQEGGKPSVGQWEHSARAE